MCNVLLTQVNERIYSKTSVIAISYAILLRNIKLLVHRHTYVPFQKVFSFFEDQQHNIEMYITYFHLFYLSNSLLLLDLSR